MSKTILLAVLAAVLVGSLIVEGVFIYQARAGRKTADQTVELLAWKKDSPAGALVNAGDVETVAVPAAAARAMPDLLRKTDENVALLRSAALTRHVFGGELVRLGDFQSSPADDADGLITLQLRREDIARDDRDPADRAFAASGWQPIWTDSELILAPEGAQRKNGMRMGSELTGVVESYAFQAQGNIAALEEFYSGKLQAEGYRRQDRRDYQTGPDRRLTLVFGRGKERYIVSLASTDNKEGVRISLLISRPAAGGPASVPGAKDQAAQQDLGKPRESSN